MSYYQIGILPVCVSPAHSERKRAFVHELGHFYIVPLWVCINFLLQDLVS